MELGQELPTRYVAATAKAFAEGGLDLYALRGASYDEALVSLVALPQVGDKMASRILLTPLDKFEGLPVDVWTDRALRDWYP